MGEISGISGCGNVMMVGDNYNPEQRQGMSIGVSICGQKGHEEAGKQFVLEYERNGARYKEVLSYDKLVMKMSILSDFGRYDYVHITRKME